MVPIKKKISSMGIGKKVLNSTEVIGVCWVLNGNGKNLSDFKTIWLAFEHSCLVVFERRRGNLYEKECHRQKFQELICKR